MALSGSFYTDVGRHWRLQLEWSATQSISGNYSDVTARLYWIARDGYGAVRSSATKTASITIDGSSNNRSASGMASLSGNQKKQIHSYTKRVNHNSDGTKSFSLSAWFDVDGVTLSGTKYNTISLSSRSFTLNTIPRASSITSDGSWTAGNSRSVTISRHSSSFTHTVSWQVQDSGGTWRTVKTATGVGTSHNGSFTVDENTNIFRYLAQAGSRSSRIQLETYSGGTKIGSTVYKTGTVTAPSRSTFKITNPTNISSASGQGAQTVYIDQRIDMSISRSHGSFTHKLVFKDENNGNTVYTATGVGTSLSWTPNSTQQSQLYQKAKDSIEIDGQVDVYTYYNGIQVRDVYQGDINFRVRESSNEPIFSSSNISYKDINPTTVGITGNNQYIIQDKSTLEVGINTGATGKNHATITKYEVTVNGVTKSITGTGVINMGTVSADSNINVTVKAIDSRGLSTSVSKVINIIPYSPPNVSVFAGRLNGFENQTELKVQGTASPISVGGVNKNSITIARRRHKNAKTSTYGSWANLSISGFPSFIATNADLSLDNLSEWDIQIEITDKLSTVIKNIKVPVGRPILFLDAGLQSVGIGDFPVYENELRISGRIVFGRNMWASSNQGEGSGALFLNNSDITGVNGIFFNDPANNKGEGLLFLKPGKPDASSDFADYNTFYIRDQWFYLDDMEFMMVKDTPSGSSVILGGDALTIVGAGESVDYVYSYYVGGGQYKDDSESLFLTADVDVFIQTNWDANNPSNMKNFVFNTSGDFNAPRQVNSGENLRMNGYNTIENVNNRLYLDGKGLDLQAWGRTFIGFNSDGKDMVQSQTIYNRTYSGSANLCMTNYGTIGRITSAKKYKLEIQEVDTDTLAERILLLEPKSWYDKFAVEQYAEYLTRLYNGEDVSEMDVPYLQRYYGLIAEDLVDAGLGMFVQYGKPNEDGEREIEGIEYDRVWTMLIPIIREQRDKIEKLESRLDALESKSVATN